MAKEKRSGILDQITNRTKAISLICLIVEALFLASLPAFPDDQRIYILLMFGFILAMTLLGLFFLEYKVPQIPQQLKLRSFCKCAEGYWWSIGATPNSVGFAHIEPDETNITLRVNGNVYDSNGNLRAVWSTKASCTNLERRLYYYWDGWHTLCHTQTPNEKYDGFGEIYFDPSPDRFNTGTGVFSDTNLTDVKSTIRKSSKYLRCSEQEVCVMLGGDKKEIGRLVQKKLKEA